MKEGEFELIKRLFQHAGGSSKAFTRLGIGDDASIHRADANQELAVSTDSSVQGVHWPHDFPLAQAADRAVCSALSDLAAMGAEPVCAWLNVMAVDTHALEQMGQGSTTALQRYDIELAGGDTCRSATNTIAVTVAGQLPKQTAMRRGAAKACDSVYLCGRVGFHALGLKQWFDGQKKGDFVPYFSTISPLLEAGMQLRQADVACCIDVSDGLIQDAGHVCIASNIGMDINVDHVPEWERLCQSVGAELALQAVTSGGEDYALLFTAPANIRLPQDLAICIGQCRQGSGVNVFIDGALQQTKESGFDHFS